MARIQANRRDPSKAVAFLGQQLCFLERDSVVPPVGTAVEVMITRAVYGKNEFGHPNYRSLQALMIDVIDPERHMLVAIDGFECSGSMCRTTAYGRETDGSRLLTSDDVHPRKLTGESTSAWSDRSRGSMWLTPGRTDIFVADNVNARFGESRPTRPTNVWVQRAEYVEKSGCGVRVAGLTRVEDGDWAKLVRGASGNLQ
jgi:hypothetical protein